MIAALLTWLTVFLGWYEGYRKLPPIIHGAVDFAVGVAVGWVWRWHHGPIF